MERPLKRVPQLVFVGLALTLATQLAMRGSESAPSPRAEDLPTAPGTTLLRLASLGDPIPIAKTLMLYLQAFDYRSGSQVPYQRLDYDHVQSWLSQILMLDPDGQYPLMAASRLYAEVPNVMKKRKMLAFIFDEYLKDPDRRWPWLAHAAAIARDELKDLPLAQKYAHAIQEHAKGKDVPLWAKEMEAFILEDMNELERARIMIGGFIESGQVTDAGELHFLDQRLKDIEARAKTRK